MTVLSVTFVGALIAKMVTKWFFATLVMFAYIKLAIALTRYLPASGTVSLVVS